MSKLHKVTQLSDSWILSFNAYIGLVRQSFYFVQKGKLRLREMQLFDKGHTGSKMCVHPIPSVSI